MPRAVRLKQTPAAHVVALSNAEPFAGLPGGVRHLLGDPSDERFRILWVSIGKDLPPDVLAGERDIHIAATQAEVSSTLDRPTFVTGRRQHLRYPATRERRLVMTRLRPYQVLLHVPMMPHPQRVWLPRIRP